MSSWMKPPLTLAPGTHFAYGNATHSPLNSMWVIVPLLAMVITLPVRGNVLHIASDAHATNIHVSRRDDLLT